MLVTRRAYVEAEQRLQAEGNIERGRGLQNFTRQTRATVGELLSPVSRAKIEAELFGDVAGWAIGNSSAAVFDSQLAGGLLSKIPFNGAIVAMLTVPRLNNLREQMREDVGGRTA